MTEPTLFIHWGTGPDQATPRYSELVAGGLQARPPNRRRVQPLRLRLDAAGGYHVHSPGDGAILSFDAHTRFVAKVALPAAGDVLDFAVGPLAYLALFDTGGGRALVAVDRAGTASWRRADLDADVDRVVLTQSGLFLSASLQPGSLLELEAATGATRRRHALPHEAIDPVAAPDGVLVAATYLPDLRRRGVLTYDPATGQTAIAAAGPELYATLLGVVGTTAAHELVIHGPTRSDPQTSLFIVGPDAQVRRHVGLDAILAPAPGEITVGRFVDATLVLDGKRPGLPATVALPDAMRSVAPERLDLVEVGPRRIVFDVRAPDGVTAERQALDVTSGQTAPVATGHAPVLIPGMQPPTTWQVAGDGRVLIPVVSEAGLAIVAILPP